MSHIPPTANLVLTEFINRLNNAGPDLTEGVYITGSIPLDNFYTGKSDADFIVLLKETPSEDVIESYKAIHRGITKSFRKPFLNGHYVVLNENAALTFFLTVIDGKPVGHDPYLLDKVILWEWKHHSVTASGTYARELPLKITMDEVKEQLHRNTNSYWADWIKKHDAFGPPYFFLLLFPRLTEWGVLGVARQLYTLQTGTITSKLHAGEYMLEQLPEQFHGILKTAIRARKEPRLLIRPSFRRAKETLECMKFMIEKVNAVY